MPSSKQTAAGILVPHRPKMDLGADSLLPATTGHGSALPTEEKEAPDKARAPPAKLHTDLPPLQPPWAAEQTGVEKEVG